MRLVSDSWHVEAAKSPKAAGASGCLRVTVAPSGAAWRVGDLGRLPERGMSLPGRLVEGKSALSQDNRWISRIGGTVALVGVLMTTAAIVRLADFADPEALWIVALIVGIAAAFAGLSTFATYGAQWVLDRGSGFGLMRLTRLDSASRWLFPLSAVARVAVVQRDRPDGTWHAQVALDLADPEEFTVLVPLAEHRSLRAAREAGQRIAHWLGVPVVEREVPGPRPEFEVPVAGEAEAVVAVPARPIGGSALPGPTSAMACDAEGLRLVLGATARTRSLILWATATGILAVLTAMLIGIAAGAGAAAVCIILGILGGLAASLGGYGLYVRDWCVFDRRLGRVEVRVGPLAVRLPIPIVEVAAAQVLYAGWQRSENGPSRRMFELNLVLTNRERLNLARSDAGALLRSHGERISAFLGVPLVDQMGGL